MISMYNRSECSMMRLTTERSMTNIHYNIGASETW